MRNRLVLAAVAATLVLASCGGGSDSSSDDAAPDAPVASSESESVDDATSGSTPVTEPSTETESPADVSQGGVVTVGGTEYVFLADLQCGIFESVGQYYISGSLPDVEGGFLSYSRDDEIHEITVEIGEERYSVLTADVIESTIEGNVVTGTATVSEDLGGGKAEVTFRFSC